MLKIKEAIIVEGRYDRIKLCSLIDTAIIETGGFRVFKDKERQSLIRTLARTRGIILLTDSDSAGFVIRNFLRGTVDTSMIKNAYIPSISGKEKRKEHASKENLLGVEGVTDEIIINAIINSGATVLSENTVKKENDSEINKALFYELGLTGSENSEKKRKELLKKLDLPTYMTTNAMVSALSMILTRDELIKLCCDIEV